MNDIKAVLWKEWREYLLQYGSVTRWLMNMALLVGVIGIFLPLQFGRTTIESVNLLFWLWIPLLTVMNGIADGIAGERERHTLETLLASRLPDYAILTGKIGVPVAQSWLMMLAAALLALITVNVTASTGQLIMYPASVAFGLIFLPPLGGLLVAGIGVIASTHAATVRQAYQRMLIPFLMMAFIPGLGMSLLSADALEGLYSPEFAQHTLGGWIVGAALLLACLDMALLLLAFKRFRRSGLMAD